MLCTSLSAEQREAGRLDEDYRKLSKAERAFRHIKSYLKIRPIFHYLRRRVRAHMLLCFLAFYLVKKMELSLRAAGESRSPRPGSPNCRVAWKRGRRR